MLYSLFRNVPLRRLRHFAVGTRIQINFATEVWSPSLPPPTPSTATLMLLNVPHTMPGDMTFYTRPFVATVQTIARLSPLTPTEEYCNMWANQTSGRTVVELEIESPIILNVQQLQQQ